jgi:hypothetical protein
MCAISLSKLENIVILMIKITQIEIGGIHFYNAFAFAFYNYDFSQKYLFSFVEEHECITNIIHN